MVVFDSIVESLCDNDDHESNYRAVQISFDSTVEFDDYLPAERGKKAMHGASSTIGYDVIFNIRKDNAAATKVCFLMIAN